MPEATETPATAQKPQLECDLVMKGGITSGIVYPPLVIDLHKKGYAFRSVGGTSAGAIAAAVTAAAEFGKARKSDGTNSDSYKDLADVSQWLSGDGNLRKLFQPSRVAAPLMNTLFAYSEMKSVKNWVVRLSLVLARHTGAAYFRGAVLGALVALAFTWMVSGTVAGLFRWWGLPVLLASAIVGGFLVGIAGLVRILTSHVPTNDFGLCTGRSEKVDDTDPTVLTDWLSTQIDKLAAKPSTNGTATPLTFGDLWHCQSPGATVLPGARRIDLRMMTSNLSQNRPYLLPFDEDDLFIFSEPELKRFFPPNVVAHMVDRSPRCIGFNLPEGYHFLPPAADLPVIFATRLSLSFPVLISMVPLYTVGQNAFEGTVQLKRPPANGNEAGRVVMMRETSPGQWDIPSNPRTLQSETHLQRNWFSDGGICSNFPIHFFDAWLPTRPTFGVNLTSQLAKGVQSRSAETTESAPFDRPSTSSGGSLRANASQPESAPPAAASSGSRSGEYVENVETRQAVRARSCFTANQAPAPESFDDSVFLPAPGETLAQEWIPIDGMARFAETIFRTAQNFRDNMQAQLPSYRERIVQIRLTDEEGGLNLDMDQDTIKKVVKKGEIAGNQLSTRFVFPHHQWVRFLVLMKQIEANLNRMQGTLKSCKFYLETIGDPRPAEFKDFPYQRKAETWFTTANARMKRLGDLLEEFTKEDPPTAFSDDAPAPEPVLRCTPQV